MTNLELRDMLQLIKDNINCNVAYQKDHKVTIINDCYPDSVRWVIDETIKYLATHNEGGKIKK